MNKNKYRVSFFYRELGKTVDIIVNAFNVNEAINIGKAEMVDAGYDCTRSLTVEKIKEDKRG